MRSCVGRGRSGRPARRPPGPDEEPLTRGGWEGKGPPSGLPGPDEEGEERGGPRYADRAGSLGGGNTHGEPGGGNATTIRAGRDDGPARPTRAERPRPNSISTGPSEPAGSRYGCGSVEFLVRTFRGELRRDPFSGGGLWRNESPGFRRDCAGQSRRPERADAPDRRYALGGEHSIPGTAVVTADGARSGAGAAPSARSPVRTRSSPSMPRSSVWPATSGSPR